jgi:hypothetical protein
MPDAAPSMPSPPLSRPAHLLCVLGLLLAGGFGATQGFSDEATRRDRSVPASIESDQELSREDFDQLFGRVPNTPLVKTTKPVVVYSGIELQDIRDIDAASGSYAVRGFLWYYWDDPRFSFDGGDIESLKWAFSTVSGHAWIPAVEFDNSVEDVRRWGETVEIFPDGEVEYWCYFAGTFSDQDGLMDFRRFPCEVLPVSIDLTSPYQKVLLELRHCRESDPTDGIKELRQRRHPEFTFTTARATATARSYTSENERIFPVLRFTVEAKRNKGYYLIHIILPILAILAVFLVGQRITIDQFEARIGLALTCLLSLIAYTFSFSDSLPKLGYLTLMDYFVTTNYLLIATGTIATCTRRWPSPIPRVVQRLADLIDRALPWCAIALLAIVLLLLGIL